MFEEIKEQFKEVIRYSQGIEDPKVDDLFADWYKGKEAFIEAMGGLIYEFPETVSFELDAKAKSGKIDEFIGTCEWQFNNDKLADFIKTMSDGFYNNMTTSVYELDNGTKLPKGMKLVKAFKYFESDKNALHELQSRASQIIQSDKVSGKLCISVHPLDYLSSSENVHNWRSCHSLDGDYRAGNLSYMADNHTIICYLKSEDDTNLPNFPHNIKWNSKKWRVLLHISEDWAMMFAGRQYPFSSETGINYLKDHLLKANLCSWDAWHTEKVSSVNIEGETIRLFRKYIPIEGQLIEMDKLVCDTKNSLQYNDLLKSTCYDPMYSFRSHRWSRTAFSNYADPIDTKFSIGKEVKCLHCGDDVITYSNMMRCTDCEAEYGEDSEDFYYCSYCERRVHYDDAHWLAGDEVVCQQCFDNVIQRCDCCGEYYHEDDITYDRETGTYTCEYCRRMDY